MSHHPDKIKNPARMHLSYAPSGILNVVELNRKARPLRRVFAVKESLPLILENCHSAADLQSCHSERKAGVVAKNPRNLSLRGCNPSRSSFWTKSGIFVVVLRIQPVSRRVPLGTC